MRHRPRRLHFLDFQRDGVGLVNAHPDREDGLALHVFQHDNGHVGYGVHHQATDFHFHFHGGLPWSNYVLAHQAVGRRPGHADLNVGSQKFCRM